MTASKRIVVAISGASGSIYGLRLLKALLERGHSVYATATDAGLKVMAHETDYRGGPMLAFLESQGVTPAENSALHELAATDLFAPIASGSFRHDGMVVAPCSMRTLGAIANGIADDLVHRAADVCLKERRPLILLPRETPLSAIHLKNMLRADRAGAVILPPAPSFYHHPGTIEDLVDTVIARVLDHLGIDHDLTPRWGEP